MRLTRRGLISLTATSAATLFIADPRRGHGFARAQASVDPFVVTLEANNAWDPTFLTDPHVGASFTPWSAPDIRTVPGTNIRYAPNLLPDGSKAPYSVGAVAQDFFLKHGAKLLVVNGVDNATVSHDVGPRVAFTGTNREGVPSLPGLMAAARGASLPLSLMTSGGFVNAEGLVPVTRTAAVSVLLGLARSNIANFTATTNERRFHDDSLMATLRERVQLRDARRAAASRVPREIAGLNRLAPTRNPEMVAELDALSEAFASASTIVSANPVIPRAAACLAAMAAGSCIAAHLETTESFDTHDDHDALHPRAMQHLLEIVDFVLDTAANDTRIAERGLVLVVGSDFGRTKYNEDGGKDHWPVTSMMVAAVGAAAPLVEGGRSIGATATTVGGVEVNGLVAAPVKEDDGDLVPTEPGDPDGFILTPGHVHLALRQALGLNGDAITARFPLTNVVPQAPLPLLKRG